MSLYRNTDGQVLRHLLCTTNRHKLPPTEVLTVSRLTAPSLAGKGYKLDTDAPRAVASTSACAKLLLTWQRGWWAGSHARSAPEGEPGQASRSDPKGVGLTWLCLHNEESNGKKDGVTAACPD